MSLLISELWRQVTAKAWAPSKRRRGAERDVTVGLTVSDGLCYRPSTNFERACCVLYLNIAYIVFILSLLPQRTTVSQFSRVKTHSRTLLKMFKPFEKISLVLN